MSETQTPIQTPPPVVQTPPVTPAVTPAVTPQDPVPPPDDECPPEPCIPIPVPMNVEIQPDITLCVNKPSITLKNKAVCICTPCTPPPS
jgi:hypothetical protein